jgi:hypothetical protein
VVLRDDAFEAEDADRREERLSMIESTLAVGAKARALADG